MTRTFTILLASITLTVSAPAAAWGDLGHKVTAIIAYRHLTPVARVNVDALLAADTDSLTEPDFASRATWADKYRDGHQETAAWHFIDIEIDSPDLESACFGFPRLDTGRAASAGPAKDCIVNKIGEFEAELHAPSTPSAERLMALKFLEHFVGDLHQPLHASDHFDRGGNCVGLIRSSDRHDRNLHAYWDVGVVEALGRSAVSIADALDAHITTKDVLEWERGDERTWAIESFALGRKDAYALESLPTCDVPGEVRLTAAYEARATADAAVQLQKAGIRMAVLLNRALGSKPFP